MYVNKLFEIELKIEMLHLIRHLIICDIDRFHMGNKSTYDGKWPWPREDGVL